MLQVLSEDIYVLRACTKEVINEDMHTLHACIQQVINDKAHMLRDMYITNMTHVLWIYGKPRAQIQECNAAAAKHGTGDACQRYACACTDAAVTMIVCK